MPASTTETHHEASLDVNLLKELGKKALIDALNSVRKYSCCQSNSLDRIPFQVNGAKTLVLDYSLAGPLGLVTEVALLKVHSA